jgi:isopenicillin N synthase-like dioxygenase
MTTNLITSEATLDHIPVIDLGPLLAGHPGAVEGAAEQIRHACEQIGFFFILNHGLDIDRVGAVFAAMRELFALPEEVKRAVRMNTHQCGWQPMGVDHGSWDVTDRQRPAVTEAFKYTGELEPSDPDHQGGRRFRGHNQWPAGLSDRSRAVFSAYFTEIEALGRRLLPPLAVSLDLPADYFGESFTRPDSVMRCAYYPVAPHDDGQLGLIAHRDLGFLTLIPPATGPGLQILLRNGRWIDQPVIEGAVLVNTGETLCAWTNDRYIATPHRVLASAEEDRYSSIFFMYPDLEATVEPVTPAVTEGRPRRYRARPFEEIYAEFVSRHLAYTEAQA